MNQNDFFFYNLKGLNSPTIYLKYKMIDNYAKFILNLKEAKRTIRKNVFDINISLNIF